MPQIPRPRRLVDRWAESVQQGARRNAMLAATALAQRRAERAEVEEYLAALDEVPVRSVTNSAS